LDFSAIYRGNRFGSLESFSGEGSTLWQTRLIRRALPKLLTEIGARSILDVPCGDFNWIKEVPLGEVRYCGGDIVPELVEANQRNHGNERRSFRRLDIIRDTLPQVDLIFCRDCLVHLPFEAALAAIRNFKRSGSTWLLTTTFEDRQDNQDLIGLTWRTLNLRKPPFNFPEPARLINEGCTQENGQFADKCLGLWRLDDL
jgi:hypothetical protein